MKMIPSLRLLSARLKLSVVSFSTPSKKPNLGMFKSGLLRLLLDRIQCGLHTEILLCMYYLPQALLGSEIILKSYCFKKGCHQRLASSHDQDHMVYQQRV